jgi:uncharacterized flavoprotein (TIGR03862 family)
LLTEEGTRSISHAHALHVALGRAAGQELATAEGSTGLGEAGERGSKGVAIVGGGPAGLIAAEVLGRAGVPVTIYDRMPSFGRKLLMAGRGGLNLTHSEDYDAFLLRYGGAAARLDAALRAFPPAALRAWAEQLGEPTFVGSSGRVFPKSFKASPLLRAWLRRLAEYGVVFAPQHEFLGFNDNGLLLFGRGQDRIEAAPAATVLALGGASWPRLGANGHWVGMLRRAGVAVRDLAPSNVGFRVEWSGMFRDRFAGEPLKRIALSFGERVVRGEAMITQAGIEGGAVYALSAALRDAVALHGGAVVHVDLRPDLAEAEIAAALARPRAKQSASTFLRKAVGLPAVAIGLVREAGPLPKEPGELARAIKAVPIRLVGTMPIERAISSAGGVTFDEIDEHFMLRRRPGVFVAGEMLDWEAPTGGYLLQACFATGIAAAEGALDWVGGSSRRPD